MDKPRWRAIQVVLFCVFLPFYLGGWMLIAFEIVLIPETFGLVKHAHHLSATWALILAVVCLLVTANSFRFWKTGNSKLLFEILSDTSAPEDQALKMSESGTEPLPPTGQDVPGWIVAVALILLVGRALWTNRSQ